MRTKHQNVRGWDHLISEQGIRKKKKGRKKSPKYHFLGLSVVPSMGWALTPGSD